MIRIEMLPAAHGDCLWIEYGTGDTVHRILIDGGPAHTYPALRERILHVPAGQRAFELLVITHIDCDHIDGIIRLLQDADALNCSFKRIWFNGFDHLNQVPDPAGLGLGPEQGEYLSLLIDDYQQRRGETVWNVDFGGSFIAIAPDSDELPVIESLPDGLKLTVLSPTHERLLKLKDVWDEALTEEGLVSGDEWDLRRRLEESRSLRPLGDVLGDEAGEALDEDAAEMPAADGSDLHEHRSEVDELGGSGSFGSDSSAANGSSIALLLEYQGDRFLLAGDAWPAVLAQALDRLVPAAGKLSLKGFKLPHHGSVGNVTEDLLGRMSCVHYLISTSGAVFRHPDARAVELLLECHNGRGKPRLHFNYRSVTTEAWDDGQDQKARRYVALYPKGTSLQI